MKLRALFTTLLVTCMVAALACDDDKKAAPAPTSTPPSSSAAASTPAPIAPPTSAEAPEIPPLSAEAFCARLFGNVYGDFVKACSEEDKKSDGYKLALLVATMPLEECNFVVRDGVASGRMTFDAMAAAHCAAAGEKTKRSMKSVYLATPDIDEIPECKTVVTGKQADGQPCHSTYECVSPLTCVGAKDKKDGACKPAPTKAGEPCDGAAWHYHDFGHRRRCGAGLACDVPGAKPTPVVCRKAIPSGGACVESDECEDGFTCHAGKCDSNPPAGVDGPCDDDTDDCKDGLYCKRDKGQKIGKCAEKKAAGQACTDVFECRGECRKPAGKSDGACAAVCGSG